MALLLSAQIEAILFYKAEPLSVKRLAQIFNKDETEIKNAIRELKEELKGRGLALVEWEDEITLGTSKEMSTLIKNLMKEELVKDLGKASMETLSIILYQGPISRAEIDYIRGVNSSFILRNLLIRGLIDRIENPKDQRSFLYKPTLDLLSHLGLSKITDLPDYEIVRKDIESFKGENQEEKQRE
ncbi:MAG TPA: SMC-Scp complex subunit ScpB [Candidatus Paceibacterota bacterium]